MKQETRLVNAIREALNATGRCRVVRNNTGFDIDRKVRYGIGTGGPDLVGVLKGGLCFCIEVKTPTGRTSPEQVAWWRAAKTWCIEGGIARSVADALRLLDEAEESP